MTADATLSRVAAHGLPGAPTPVCEQPLDDAAWRSLVGRARGQRLQGLVAAAVESGALPTTDDQWEDAATEHVAACGSVLQLERRMLAVTADLQDAGLDVLVLKGSALAHLDYPDPAMRVFGDVDLLLRAEQLDEAVQVLQRAGNRRQTPALRPGFEQRFGKTITMLGPDGLELDLHRTLVFGSFGFRVDLDELFDSSVTFDLAGRQVHALGPETRLLHACYHAALSYPPRLGSVRDVAQLLLTGSHEPARVLDLARAWEGEAVVTRALDLCRDLLDVTPTGPIAAALADRPPTRREQRALDSFVGANRRHAARVLASLPYLDTMGERLSLVGQSLLPSSEFARDRGGRLAWLRRGIRSLGGRRGRR